MTNFLTNAFVFLGFYGFLSQSWRIVEENIYGFSQESIVDTMICTVMAFVVAWELCVRRIEQKQRKAGGTDGKREESCTGISSSGKTL